MTCFLYEHNRSGGRPPVHNPFLRDAATLSFTLSAVNSLSYCAKLSMMQPVKMLYLATEYCYTRVIRALLEVQGIDVNVKNKYCEETPLHLAASYGHKDVVDALIKNRA